MLKQVIARVVLALAIFLVLAAPASALTFDQAFNLIWNGTEDECNAYGAPLYECLHANVQRIYGPFATGVNQRGKTQWWGYGYFTQADVFGLYPNRSCTLQRNYDPWGDVVYQQITCYSGLQG